MYCSNCGTRVSAGATRCVHCGVSIRPTTGEVEREAVSLAPRRVIPDPATVGTCGRCGYRGDGIPYFSRGSRVAMLVGLAVVTAGAMGMGGVLYYFLRRDYLICPRCHASWGNFGEQALARTAAEGADPSVSGMQGVRRDSRKQNFSTALFVLAGILALVGVVGTAVPPLVAAGAAAVLGVFLQRSAEQERQERRAALLAALQPHVLRLAAQHGAQLTVTETATELGWTLRRAEKVLQSLDDGVRVSSEVTDEGLIVYEFRELARSLERPV